MRNFSKPLLILALCPFIIGLSYGGQGAKTSKQAQDTSISAKHWPLPSISAKKDSIIEKKISSLLTKMDLDRKIGQMMQVSIESCTYDDIKKYHIGSVLNGGGSYPHGKKNARVKDWIAAADSFWLASMEDTVVRIPIMWGTDAVHGHNNVKGATIFPHNIGLGAANDPELLKRIGEITAREVAATGLDWTFAPVVAVVRDDRWGRTYEAYSEYPEIVTPYAKAIIEGLQGNFDDEHVLATAKHFMGDGGTFRGIDRGDNRSTEAEMIALHGQGYLAALEAGVQTIMVSYSSWNGKTMHEHEFLITEVLKKRWGFDGLVISDWNGIAQAKGCTNSNCPNAVNAGIDMFMVPFENDWKPFIKNVKDEVTRCDIPMSRIDDAVKRILRVKAKAGLFEKPQPSKRKPAGKEAVLGSADHRKVAREAVRKSLVLLKNKNNILPLSRTLRILVAGKSADCLANQCGGWSVTWQGAETSNQDFPQGTSVLAAVKKVAKNTVFDETGRSAKKGTYDVAIVVIGETPYAEYEGDIKGALTLEHAKMYPEDLKVLETIKKAGIPIITLFVSGRPLYVNKEINCSDAFIAAWLPGTEADGITDVVFRNEKGEVNFDFSGKLAFSWPREQCQTSVNRGDAGYNPLFPYGFGLAYAGPVVKQDTLSEGAADGYGCNGEKAAELNHRNPLILLSGKADSSIKPLIGDPSNWAGITVKDSAIMPNIRVSYVNDKAGKLRSALHIACNGISYCGLMSEPKDLSGYYMAHYAVAFDVKVDQAPEANVEITITCGFPCRASYDITKEILALKPHVWSEIRLPLTAFAKADYFRINGPFMVETSGKVDITLSNIRWEAKETR
jgi:beta-glucosidase